MSNSVALARHPHPLAARWREMVGAWRAASARAQAEPAIDDQTLRDLGLSRSELPSFRAEAGGLVAQTRLRVALRSG
jgi:hypothetical protein